MSFLAALVLSVAVAVAVAANDRCTYRYSVWNVTTKSSLRHVTVDKPRSELTASENGAGGCTPCGEDQREVKLSSGHRFKACKAVVEKFRAALETALARGQTITSVVGYSPQMSRGPTDNSGDRTQLSNHAFGVALDVNEDANGLYESCPAWAADCRLRKGGAYRPGADRRSFEKTSAIVLEMQKAGFRWGGDLPGRQKDFMHFSATGG